MDSRHWIPDFLTVKLGFRISIISGIPDSLSCIPDSKAQDSGFHNSNFQIQDFTSKNFPDCLNYSSWGEFYCPRKLVDVRTYLSELSSTESRQKHHFNSDYVTNTPTIHGQVSKSLLKALTFSRNSTRADTPLIRTLMYDFLMICINGV